MSLRYGDATEVDRNRGRFYSSSSLDDASVALMEVDHRDEVKRITKSMFSTNRIVVEAEALHTADTSIALALLTADCLPVGLFDEVTGAIALMHLGWRPIDMRLVPKTIGALVDTYGAKLENLRAYIGHGISAASYAFPTIQQERDPIWAPHLYRKGDLIHIDLKARVVADLVEAGVLRDKIEISPIDTFASTDHFSHVRSRMRGELEGRIMTVLSHPHAKRNQQSSTQE